MWAPINGFKTGNGAGPRIELTEPNDYFTFSGKHTMMFTQQVKEVSGCSDVCIGQIKGDSFDELYLNSSKGINATADGQIVEGKVMSGSCLIVVELIYDASDKRVVAHTRDEDCNNINNDMGYYDLDEEIHIEMEVDGYYVYISSDKASTKKIDYSHWQGAHYGMHFKVGVYDQCEGSTSTEGSKSKLSNLKIAHSG